MLDMDTNKVGSCIVTDGANPSTARRFGSVASVTSLGFGQYRVTFNRPVDWNRTVAFFGLGIVGGPLQITPAPLARTESTFDLALAAGGGATAQAPFALWFVEFAE